MKLNKSLHPDVEKAISKIEIRIKGYFFDDEKKNVFVTADWNIDGKQISVYDLIKVIEGGKDQIIDVNNKVDQN